MKIELTEEQERIIQQGRSLEVVDPQTNKAYLVMAREPNEVSQGSLPPSRTTQEQEPAVAPGILSSQRAYWRDLPELLENKRNLGKWIAYHRDERVGIASKGDDLIREIARRKIPEDEYDLFVIEKRNLPPWEPEEIDGGGNEVDDIQNEADTDRS